MSQDLRGRFILLDLGHPMNTEIAKTVLESLENALILGLSFPLNGIEFGLSVLNSDFTIIQTRSEMRQNFDAISKSLQDLQKITKDNTKVTIQKYKEIISQSLDKVFRDFLPKLGNSKCNLKGISIQIAIITKKTGSVLVEILMDVLKKLQETDNKKVMRKFKIVQILNENEEIYKTQQKNELIDYTTCLNHLHYLTCFFKNWLLNPEEHLEILINEHLNLSLKCDVDNCIIKPISPLFDQKSNFKVSNRIPSLDKLKPKNLQIISKIPISGLCPTLVFGIPRRVTATVNKTSTLAEFQMNRQLFKGLCLELQNTSQGLLTRSRNQTDGNEIFTYQFITSGGDMLLMNDVAPEELYLPKGMKTLKSDIIDEDVAAFLKVCLDDIKLLDDYCPKDFPSGMYDYFMYYLIQSSQGKVPSNFNSNGERRSLTKRDQNYLGRDEQVRKKQKLDPDEETKQIKNVHPALLPEDMVQKYRKINAKVFNLPEFGTDFSKDLQRLEFKPKH